MAFGVSSVALMSVVGCTNAPVRSVSPGMCRVDVLHSHGDEPKDLGGGLIRRDTSFASFSTDEHYVDVTDCRSGEQRTLMRRGNFGEDDRPFDHSVNVDKVLIAFQDRDTSNPLAYLEALAEEQGVAVQSDVTSEEECGCRAYYPELRGGKSSYHIVDAR
ncbi:hypothetical protein JJJ17_05660 [Paracoccus caeni]|uniref:Uncharacterized protein n=1 Tax=Paracoccus caeni TaxID=657651 RepID=A0A934SDL5_9RHOB|nr:hypothetical protein [Paracoccus caeni]MBK4215409.1 hypothetical protein [Paracoccus caeni]